MEKVPQYEEDKFNFPSDYTDDYFANEGNKVLD